LILNLNKSGASLSRIFAAISQKLRGDNKIEELGKNYLSKSALVAHLDQYKGRKNANNCKLFFIEIEIILGYS
jgi:hypothetical protein